MSAAPAHPHSGRSRFIPQVDFEKAPFLVIWETTQACALACTHCRASAQPQRDPLELTTEEGHGVIRATAEMGTPLIIFSGGDPTNRPDLLDFIHYGRQLGLRVATIPAATDCLTRKLVFDLKDAGLEQMALSLDQPRADLHDAFRATPGAFAKTMAAIEWAHEAGLPLQINTTLSGTTAPYFEEMAALVERLGVVFWEIFFLVPVGRGTLLPGLSAEQCESLFATIYRIQKKGTFIVKVTEAPHYRRFVAQQETAAAEQTQDAGQMPALLTRSEGPGHTVGLAPRGVNAGNGFLFVSHQGEIYPSGFLPLSAGNVRRDLLAGVYRNSPLFTRLRNPDELLGRCGRCEYRRICGGSRSRALALTGDPFRTDPWCGYQPRGDTRDTTPLASAGT